MFSPDLARKGVLDRIVVPQDALILISGACEYVTLQGKEELMLHMEFSRLSIGRLSWIILVGPM